MPTYDNEVSGAVFDAVDIGLILLDGDRRTIGWNAWVEAATGINSSHAVGKSLEQLVPHLVTRFRSAISEAFDSGSSSLLTHALHPSLLPLRTRAGRELIHNVSIRPIGPRPYSRCLLQVTDVTVAVQRERVLRERQNARYDAVVNSAPDAILTMDADGKIQLANPAAGWQFGYPPQDLIGRPLSALLRASASWDEVWAAVSEGNSIGRPVELEAIRRDGSYSYLEVSASRWLADSRTFVTAILRDVNERRAVEATLLTLNQTLERRVEERTAELMLAEEQLRQAQKMEAVGQLTGGIAHDFNNLLTGVIGSLDMLRTRVAQGRTDTIERYVTAATTSANRAAALTHRLLAFARRQPLDPKPVQANALVTSLEDLFRRTVGEAVTLDVVLAGELWPILCDPNQLENALLNLVINARDAMPDGGKLTIETCNVSLDSGDRGVQHDVKPGHYVCICVTDTGSGMPENVIERAFDPFFTTKPIGQGTGLGLSMVYGFARQSEGHAEIHSEVGRGTAFKIYLPRYRGDSPTDIETLTEAHTSWAGTGETVLVVEDEPVVRSLIIEILEDLGYRTMEATDGLEGLMILQSEKRIDLLITDVGLPGLNGRQLADIARETRSSLKVLFITGYAENATLAAGFLESGMQMITKPFAVDRLAQKIRSILSNDPGPG